MSITQIPPAEAPEVEAEAEAPQAEALDTSSATIRVEATPAAPPQAWEAPPDSPGPFIGLTVGLGILILLVVAFIVASGITGAVWLLVIGMVALVAALGLLLGELMRFIN